MFNSAAQMLEQIRAAEDGRAEFKELRLSGRRVTAPHTEDLAGELVAFANAEGGAVFLGVDDAGAVIGIPADRLDAVEQWLLNIATHNCDPPIRPVVRKALLPAASGGDRRILLVEIPRGIYVHRTSGGRYFVRIGSTKRDLIPAELARLFQQRGREYVFDEQPVLAAAVEHLNRHRLEAFFGRSPTIPWLDLLRNTRVTVRDADGVDRPTVAGLLVFGTEPTDFLASGSIEAADYRGARLSSDDLIHAERIAACSCSPTGWSSTAPASCPTPSRSTTCPTAPSPATNSWSTSCRESAASAPARYSSNRAAKACARFSTPATPTPAAARNTPCSATNCASPCGRAARNSRLPPLYPAVPAGRPSSVPA